MAFNFNALLAARQGHLALAAITASPASLTYVIDAGVFGAENADITRPFAANRARKRVWFHQYFFDVLEAGAGTLLMIARHRCASSSAILKFCSVLDANSRM